jgi:hypothetical protein
VAEYAVFSEFVAVVAEHNHGGVVEHAGCV